MTQQLLRVYCLNIVGQRAVLPLYLSEALHKLHVLPVASNPSWFKLCENPVCFSFWTRKNQFKSSLNRCLSSTRQDNKPHLFSIVPTCFTIPKPYSNQLWGLFRVSGQWKTRTILDMFTLFTVYIDNWEPGTAIKLCWSTVCCVLICVSSLYVDG